MWGKAKDTDNDAGRTPARRQSRAAARRDLAQAEKNLAGNARHGSKHSTNDAGKDHKGK